MKKSDLENGMIVELRNGGIYRMYDGKIRSTYRAIDLISYTDDMKANVDPDDDIVKVYKADNYLALSTERATLIWERTDINPRAVLETAVNIYGADSQMDMAIEEMSELTKALLKYRRAFYGTKTADFDAIRDNIAEEIADVLITVEQLTIIFDNVTEINNHRDKKIARLHERLEQHNKKGGTP